MVSAVSMVPVSRLLAALNLIFLFGESLGAPISGDSSKVASDADVVHWSYADVKAWEHVNEVCTSGRRQSPINVDTAKVVSDPNLRKSKLTFNQYSGHFAGTFINNGHTVQFNIDSDIEAHKRPRIDGGGLSDKGYIFEQLHFHWGNTSIGPSAFIGAEHRIDEQSAPAEVHFVHYNAKYDSFTDALSHDDGLAVIGFLFDPVTDVRMVHTDYSQLTNLIHHIATEGSTASTSFDLAKLLPSLALDSTGIYYRYNGSLTTPPCAEIVTWTVFDYRVPILTSTLDTFREAMGLEPDEVTHLNFAVKMANNFRPVQDLAGRTVTSNRHDDSVPTTSTSQTSHASNALSTLHKWLIVTVAIIASSVIISTF